jgi:hypothetical protein
VTLVVGNGASRARAHGDSSSKRHRGCLLAGSTDPQHREPTDGRIKVQIWGLTPSAVVSTVMPYHAAWCHAFALGGLLQMT